MDMEDVNVPPGETETGFVLNEVEMPEGGLEESPMFPVNP
jgi:hypothetical protein